RWRRYCWHSVLFACSRSTLSIAGGVMSIEAGHATVTLKRPDFTLDVDVRVPGQGVTGIFGPSGCGKTTLLRCIAGLEQGAHGSVGFNGEIWQSGDRNLPPWQRPVGYVFQDARLFPHMTVAGNL